LRCDLKKDIVNRSRPTSATPASLAISPARIVSIAPAMLQSVRKKIVGVLMGRTVMADDLPSWSRVCIDGSESTQVWVNPGGVPVLKNLGLILTIALAISPAAIPSFLERLVFTQGS
jgi:hypothetical protein